MKTDCERPVWCGKRLVQLDRQIGRLDRRDSRLRQISNKYLQTRPILFGGGIILTIALFEVAGDRAGLLALLISAAAFGGIAHFHARILASIRRNREWINLKRSQIARIRLDWNNMSRPGSWRSVPGHPFELD